MRGKDFDEGFEYGFVVAIGRAIGAVNNIDISDGKLNSLGMKMTVIEQLEHLKNHGYAKN